MPEIDCGCAGQLSLWITVENPVDKPNKNSSDAMSLNLKPDIALPFVNTQPTGAREGDLLAALLNAVEVLEARLNSLEIQMAEIAGRLA